MGEGEERKRPWVWVAVVAGGALLVFGVVAVVLLLAFAAPAWRNAVVAGNETSAVMTLGVIAQEQRVFLHEGGARVRYATFEQLVEDGALDQRFATDAPVVEGYRYTMSVRPKSGGRPPFFSVNADPVPEGAAGRHFYLDSETQGVRFSEGRQATAADPPHAIGVR